MNKIIATPIDHIRKDYALMWHQDHLREIVNIIKSNGREEFKIDCIEEKVYFANIGLRNLRAKELLKNFWSMANAVPVDEWKVELVEFIEKIIYEIENPDSFHIDRLRWVVNNQPNNIVAIKFNIDILKQSENRRTADIAGRMDLEIYQDLISEGAIDGAVLAILAQIDAMEER